MGAGRGGSTTSPLQAAKEAGPGNPVYAAFAEAGHVEGPASSAATCGPLPEPRKIAGTGAYDWSPPSWSRRSVAPPQSVFAPPQSAGHESLGTFADVGPLTV